MSKKEKYKLKRELGVLELTLCGVGIILGAGIYALVGKAAALGGNAVWISFLLAAIVAAFTGLSYAELSSMFPRAGAEYVYTKNAFGRRLGFVVGFFLITGEAIAAAAVSLGFAGYFSALFNTPIILVSIILIFILSFIIFLGIKPSAMVAIVFTLVEIFGLLLIIFIGLPYLGKINYFELSSFGIGGVFTAAALIFFAYIGFEEIVNLAEETKAPRRAVPKSLIIAILVTTVIYILVALSAVSILGWQSLGASSAPLADVAKLVLGSNAFLLIAIIALFSTCNTVLLMLLANSRLMYGMAEFRSLPKFLSKVYRKTGAPWIAVLLVMFFSILFVFFGDIKIVAELTDLAIFLTFLVINGAVIFLRFKRPDIKRVFKTPINIGKFPVLPFLGILFNFMMLISLEFKILIYGAVIVVLAFVMYEVSRKYAKTL